MLTFLSQQLHAPLWSLPVIFVVIAATLVWIFSKTRPSQTPLPAHIADSAPTQGDTVTQTSADQGRNFNATQGASITYHEAPAIGTQYNYAGAPSPAYKVRIEIPPSGDRCLLHNVGPAMYVDAVDPVDCGNMVVRWSPPRYLEPESWTGLPFEVESRDGSPVFNSGVFASVIDAMGGVAPQPDGRRIAIFKIVCRDVFEGQGRWMSVGGLCYDDRTRTLDIQGFDRMVPYGMESARECRPC